MPIYTSSIGRLVDGHRMIALYPGSDGTIRRIEGIVKSQRKIEGKGNLLVVELAEGGYRSLYWERCKTVQFYSVNPNPYYCDDEDTGEAYDAWKDRQLGGV